MCGFAQTPLLGDESTKRNGAIPEHQLPAYDLHRKAMAPALTALFGKERGDPRKVVELMVDVVRGEGKAKGRPWPRRIPIGPDAVKLAARQARATLALVEAWAEAAESTDRDDYVPVAEELDEAIIGVPAAQV